jgi:restriction system protein
LAVGKGGHYQFDATGTSPYFHCGKVKWIGKSIPRSHFSKDLLFSFDAFLTICRVQRNNAEVRIAPMRAIARKTEALASVTQPEPADIPDADAGIPDSYLLDKACISDLKPASV